MTSITVHQPLPHDTTFPLRQTFHRHAFIIPPLLIAMIVCAWFTTWGDWQLFEIEPFGGYYDAAARAMLHGRLDVPPHAIGFEAFVRDGKSYGYFGIAPALLRLPLVALFPSMDGRWSRSFMLIACAINLLCAYRLVLRVRGGAALENRAQKVIVALFVLCAGIGSTTVFIASRAYTYHEAIVWGGAFALVFVDCLLSYLVAPRLRVLAAAGVFAFLSFHSRATVGAGALLALCILTMHLSWRALSQPPHNSRGRKPRSPRPKTGASALGYHEELSDSAPIADQHLREIARPLHHALLATLLIALTVATYFGVNYAKFRTFDGVPLHLYARYFDSPDRMKVTAGKQFHPENIPTALVSYFGFGAVRVDAEFPWAHMVNGPYLLGSPSIDIVEPYSCIPLSMPALLFLILAGTWPIVKGRTEMLRRLRLPAVTLLAGGATVLLTVGITERYLHDFYPFLIVVGAAGVCRCIESARASRIAALLFVLAMVSIALNCAFALEFQRELVWGMPEEKRLELVHVRQSIDRLLHRTPTAATPE